MHLQGGFFHCGSDPSAPLSPASPSSLSPASHSLLLYPCTPPWPHLVSPNPQPLHEAWASSPHGCFGVARLHPWDGGSLRSRGWLQTPHSTGQAGCSGQLSQEETSRLPSSWPNAPHLQRGGDGSRPGDSWLYFLGAENKQRVSPSIKEARNPKSRCRQDWSFRRL